MTNFETRPAGKLIGADIGKVVNFRTKIYIAEIDVEIEGELREIMHTPDKTYVRIAGLDCENGDSEEFELEFFSEIRISGDRIETA